MEDDEDFKTFRDKSILDAIRKLREDPSVLECTMRDISSRAGVKLFRNATDKMATRHLNGRHLVGMLYGDDLGIPEEDEDGNLLCKRDTADTFSTYSILGSDHLMLKYKENFDSRTDNDPEVIRKNLFISQLKVKNIQLKQLATAEVHHVDIEPRFYLSKAEKLECMRCVTSGLISEREEVNNCAIEVRRLVKDAKNQINPLFVSEIVNRMCDIKRRQVYSSGEPTEEATEAIKPLLNSINYQFDFNKAVVSQFRGSKMLKATSSILSNARKSRWTVGDIKTAIDSLTVEGVQRDAICKSYLNVLMSFAVGSLADRKIDYDWGSMEVTVPGKLLPFSYACTFKGKEHVRKAFRVNGRLEMIISLIGLGVVSIVLSDVIECLRYYSAKGKEVELVSKVISLIDYITPNQIVCRDGEFPYDPFFLWKRISSGQVGVAIAVPVERRMVSGIIIGQGGVRIHNITDNTCVEMPVKPGFTDRQFGGSIIGRLEVAYVSEGTEYELPDFTHKSASLNIKGISYKVPHLFSADDYAKKFFSLVSGAGLYALRDELMKHNYNTMAARSLAKFVRSSELERAIAQKILRQRHGDLAVLMMFLPHSFGPPTQLLIRDKKIPMQTGRFTVMVHVRQDGHVFVDCNHRGNEINIGDSTVSLPKESYSALNAVNMGVARMVGDWDELEDLGMPRHLNVNKRKMEDMVDEENYNLPSKRRRYLEEVGELIDAQAERRMDLDAGNMTFDEVINLNNLPDGGAENMFEN